jgi:hypothetical protein
MISLTLLSIISSLSLFIVTSAQPYRNDDSDEFNTDDINRRPYYGIRNDAKILTLDFGRLSDIENHLNSVIYLSKLRQRPETRHQMIDFVKRAKGDLWLLQRTVELTVDRIAPADKLIRRLNLTTASIEDLVDTCKKVLFYLSSIMTFDGDSTISTTTDDNGMKMATPILNTNLRWFGHAKSYFNAVIQLNRLRSSSTQRDVMVDYIEKGHQSLFIFISNLIEIKDDFRHASGELQSIDLSTATTDQIAESCKRAREDTDQLIIDDKRASKAAGTFY